MKLSRRQRWLFAILLLLTFLVLSLYLLQRFFAHRAAPFRPDYERLTLSADSDYETIFLQTGLGRTAVDKLLSDGNFQTILDTQAAFFAPPETVCTSLLGWFTREDRLSQSGPPLVDLQPGDILITLSTHTVGWRHGHAGLALDCDTILESKVIGSRSALIDAGHWRTYSNYAVLRLKEITPQLQQEMAQYSREQLLGAPYRLTVGLFGAKAPEPDTPGFGLHCSHLVWYAWDHFGYDLDSDGGRVVTANDLLRSDCLEVVQVVGMDPRQFDR